YGMAELALDTLAPDRDFDLVVVATASPDCQLNKPVGPLFNGALPGQTGIIGIGDQGVACPFTALPFAANHLRHGLVQRVLILVMEQSLLPLDCQTWAPRDAAVAIVVSQHHGLRLDKVRVERAGGSTFRWPPADQALLIQGGDEPAPPDFATTWRPD